MPDISFLGSDGTLVAAAMESAGHYAQSVILDEFERTLTQKLGGLLYLIGIIGALITIASGGSYRFGLYLLVGPPLFFFLVQNRINSDGAEWRFGDRVMPRTEVQRATEGLLDGGGNSAGRVALFFAAWNRVTSGAVQGAINLLRLTDNGSDRDFMSKGDRYQMVFTAGTLDPRLRGFVQITLVSRCSQYLSLKRTIANPLTHPVERENLQRVLANHGARGVVLNMVDHPEIRDWLRIIFPDGNQADQDKFTCDDLWNYALAAFKKIEGANLVELIVNSTLQPGLTPDQARRRLLFKFGMTVESANVINEIATSGVPNAEETFMTYLINELAARLVYNELSQVNPAISGITLAQTPELVEEGDHRYNEDTTRMMRILQRGDEFQYKGELIIASLTMPYIQGTILYFLAAAFPFFAVTLVLPGRHTGFLLWMGLWLWAKLWDLGMAVVIMIDNMLYALLPHGPPITDAMLRDPGQTFAALLEVDPTYSVHTYYNILSSCLLAVPFITGFLVHKGGNEVIDAVTATFRDFPSKFGGSMAAYQKSFMAQQRLGMVRQMEYATARNEAWTLLAADPNLLPSARARAMANILNSNRELALTVVRGINPGAGGAAGRIISGIGTMGDQALGALADHHGRAFDTRYQADMDVMAYQQSGHNYQYRWDDRAGAFRRAHNDFAFAMAGEARALKYNSHDFRQTVPTGSLINAYNATRYIPAQRAIDTGSEEILRGLLRR